MKRLTVGRSNDCDIVIIDETDNVSRHHLVITFDFFGNMKVSDTSSNGTMINDIRMLKGASIPVTTKDRIRLGKACDLDWSLVKDPYKGLRMLILCLLVALILLGIVIGAYFWYKESSEKVDIPSVELINTGIVPDDNWTKDSTEKVAPTITTINVNNKKKSDPQPSPSKKKEKKKISKSKEKEIYDKQASSDLDSIAVF